MTPIEQNNGLEDWTRLNFALSVVLSDAVQNKKALVLQDIGLNINCYTTLLVWRTLDVILSDAMQN